MCKEVKQGELRKEIENLKEGQMLEITFGREQDETKDEATER